MTICDSKPTPLDPFAIPQATTERFTLFLLLAFFGTIMIARQIFDLILRHTSFQPFLPKDVIAIVVFFIVAVSISMIRHIQLRRMWCLQPLSQFHDDLLSKAVNALIASTTNRKVAVWVGGHPLDQSAMTFTLFGRPQFMLGRGLRMLVRKQPKLFETIIVHELAHVINRDIVINSMTFAAFRAVVFIFFLYFVVQIAELFAIFLSSELPQMFYVPEPQRIAWSQIDSLARASALAPIFVLLVLEHRRLLRIREHYADWRTASLIGEDGLAALLTSPNSGDKSARYRLLARHPSAEDRFRALKNPSAFLRAGSFDLAFAAFMTALTAYWVGHAYPPAIRDLKDLETVLLPLIAFTIFFTAYLSMIFSGLIFRELVVCSIRTESEYWKTWILGGASIVLGVELVYLFDEESNFF